MRDISPRPDHTTILFIDRIEVRAYSRATEVLTRVESAVMAVYPREVYDQVRLDRVMAEGLSQNPIVVITGILQGNTACQTALESILARLSREDRQEILDTLANRLDESCKLYLRLDKQAAYLGRLEMARGPDLMSVQIQIRVYPRCSLDVVRRALEEIITTLES